MKYLKLLSFFIAIFLLNSACHIPGASKNPPALGAKVSSNTRTSTGTSTNTGTSTGTGTNTGKAATASEVYKLAQEFSLDAAKEQDFKTAFQSFNQQGSLDALAIEGGNKDFALLIAKGQPSVDCDTILEEFFANISHENAKDQADIIWEERDDAPFVRLMSIPNVGEKIAKAQWHEMADEEAASKQLAGIKGRIDSAGNVQVSHEAYVKFLRDHVSTTPDKYLSIMSKTSFSLGAYVAGTFRRTYEQKGPSEQGIMREALFLEAVEQEGIGNSRLGAVKVIKDKFLPKAAWKENYDLGTGDEGSLFDKICEKATMNNDGDNQAHLQSALGLDLASDDEDGDEVPLGDRKEEAGERKSFTLDEEQEEGEGDEEEGEGEEEEEQE